MSKSSHLRESSGNLVFDPGRADEFLQCLTSVIGDPPDLVNHSFVIQQPELEGRCLFLETLVDKNKIEDNVLRMFAEQPLSHLPDGDSNVEDMVKRRIPIASIAAAPDLHSCAQHLLEGKALLVIRGAPRILVLDVSKFYHRPLSEPKTETTVRGPHEAFNEDIATHIGLLRKRIRTSDLRLEQMKIGKATETKVIIAYMGSLVPDQVLEEFRTRISRIHSDSILEGTYIEEWIQDKTLTIFPTLMRTERPDVVSSHLLEGRVAILVDGSPLALVGPYTFLQSFTSPEDYYQRADIATFLLWIRFLAFLLAVFIPALYIAVTSYHHELLPPALLISISAQREGVPFPSSVEAFLMMIIFEVLREAGLRMPRVAGQAISIVGALVLGEAAVSAGLVSAAMVIVVAITAIAHFVAPFYNFGITQRFLQYFYMILAAFSGGFGILCGVLFTLVHLASLQSFGVPYLAPVAPTFTSDWKDVLARVPRTWMTTFPRMNKTKRKKR
ncbi:spore germination protein [Paenibacillus thiaminolyticus]|uniref:Spore germination protein n=1 Tax=Paenibacillus thiaminolyticus TaxID=49283 RepID=A0AAP9DU15_PANTH|nr:spore germination protein [Paenibacillus thiaminolyticus]MCY9538084.1 spore germination protein [Paenibacillus thiaminolyticus]MCY9605505.1 spore germination protein [Paenibacillus thiaminolyticus]MCY9610431.1 spore germination protein [Paenibacillus thiaminolyticus]MCY9612844.1 spore germination protein [Paenibacillus thiaminolyticus]MCY9621547.1 spore germination protein [Paenibacillus thiaminolyticus]